MEGRHDYEVQRDHWWRGEWVTKGQVIENLAEREVRYAVLDETLKRVSKAGKTSVDAAAEAPAAEAEAKPTRKKRSS